MDERDWSVAERLRLTRQDRGWSQTELGRRSGVHSMLISRIETGAKKDVNALTLRRLAQALRVSSDYLLGLKDDMERLRIPAGTAAFLGSAAPVGVMHPEMASPSV